LNDVFMSVSQEVAKRQTDFSQKEYGKSLDSFLKTAAIGELDPQAQKEWNQLQQDFPDDQARVSSSDYSDSVRRLMFQTNKRKSIEQLRAMEKQNLSITENLVAQNPGLAATKTDPQTKQSYKVFPYPTPDLTPVIGNDGAIDPDTGLLTKSIIDSNKKWTAEVTSPSFLLGQVPFIRSMNLSAPQAPAPADKKAIETVSALPFRPESPSKFDMVQEPGTARVATAPVAQHAHAAKRREQFADGRERVGIDMQRATLRVAVVAVGTGADDQLALVGLADISVDGVRHDHAGEGRLYRFRDQRL
jgi:hypothetical protein